MKKLLIIAPVGALILVPVVGVVGMMLFLTLMFSNPAAAACTTDGGSVADVKGTTAASIVAGRTWSPAQLENIQLTIGIAKSMFPDTAQQAALIGLMVGYTESGYRNLANDNRAYPGLSYSLTLPNDGVGRDHASIGIMQQQAIYSWGAFGTSTWASDPKGVISRLMTPAYAIGKFFTAMATTAHSWATMDPAAVAQDVQISGPNAYATARPVAEKLWTALNTSSPAVPPPAETGWSGKEAQTAAATCLTASSVTGDKKQLAHWILTSGKVTLQGAPGDRANALGQMQMLASGTPGCNINLGVLQLIVAAANTMGHIGVRSLNRNNLCTGQSTTTFAGSYHSIQGGGHAVDFVGPGIPKGPQDLQLLNALRPYLPVQAPGDPYFTWLGQQNCRGGALNWPGFYEGNDSCDHQHINVSPKYNDTGLPAYTGIPTPPATTK